MKTDEERIPWLIIDRQNIPVNSMSLAVFNEFDKILDDIANKNPKAVFYYRERKKGLLSVLTLNNLLNKK